MSITTNSPSKPEINRKRTRQPLGEARNTSLDQNVLPQEKKQLVEQINLAYSRKEQLIDGSLKKAIVGDENQKENSIPKQGTAQNLQSPDIFGTILREVDIKSTSPLLPNNSDQYNVPVSSMGNLSNEELPQTPTVIAKKTKTEIEIQTALLFKLTVDAISEADTKGFLKDFKSLKDTQLKLNNLFNKNTSKEIRKSILDSLCKASKGNGLPYTYDADVIDSYVGTRLVFNDIFDANKRLIANRATNAVHYQFVKSLHTSHNEIAGNVSFNFTPVPNQVPISQEENKSKSNDYKPYQSVESYNYNLLTSMDMTFKELSD
jgi:hypothetical protein